MVVQTLMELAGDAGSISTLQPRFSECTLLPLVESNTCALGSLFQREIPFLSPWDCLDLTKNQAEDSTSFASIPAMPTTTCLLPTCRALPGAQRLSPHGLVPSYHPRSQAWALGTTASPEAHIPGLQANHSACQWPRAPPRRAGG